MLKQWGERSDNPTYREMLIDKIAAMGIFGESDSETITNAFLNMLSFTDITDVEEARSAAYDLIPIARARGYITPQRELEITNYISRWGNENNTNGFAVTSDTLTTEDNDSGEFRIPAGMKNDLDEGENDGG